MSFMQFDSKRSLTGPTAQSRGRKKGKKLFLLISGALLALAAGYVIYAMQVPPERAFSQVVAATAIPLDETALAGGDSPDENLIVSSSLKDESGTEQFDARKSFETCWTAMQNALLENEQTQALSEKNELFLTLVAADIRQAFLALNSGETILQGRVAEGRGPVNGLVSTWTVGQTGQSLEKLVLKSLEEPSEFYFEKTVNAKTDSAYQLHFDGVDMLYLQVHYESGLYKGNYRFALAGDGFFALFSQAATDGTQWPAFPEGAITAEAFVSGWKKLLLSVDAEAFMQRQSAEVESNEGSTAQDGSDLLNAGESLQEDR